MHLQFPYGYGAAAQPTELAVAQQQLALQQAQAAYHVAVASATAAATISAASSPSEWSSPTDMWGNKENSGYPSWHILLGLIHVAYCLSTLSSSAEALSSFA